MCWHSWLDSFQYSQPARHRCVCCCRSVAAAAVAGVHQWSLGRVHAVGAAARIHQRHSTTAVLFVLYHQGQGAASGGVVGATGKCRPVHW